MKSPICFFFLISFLVHAGVRHSSVLLRYTRQGDFESTVSRCKSNENKKKGGMEKGKLTMDSRDTFNLPKTPKVSNLRNQGDQVNSFWQRSYAHSHILYVCSYIYIYIPLLPTTKKGKNEEERELCRLSCY